MALSPGGAFLYASSQPTFLELLSYWLWHSHSEEEPSTGDLRVPFLRSSLFICPASGSQPLLPPILCASEVSLRPIDSTSIPWSVPHRRRSPIMVFPSQQPSKRGHYLPTLVPAEARARSLRSLLSS